MNSINKTKNKLITIENIIMTILVIIIIAITTLGMFVKYYDPNPKDLTHQKHVSELIWHTNSDWSQVVT